MIFLKKFMRKWNDMNISRRFLPSIAWLAAFEAVARRGSVTEAAGELSLSQSAVTRQIQKLEENLAAQLFVRDKKKLVLTASGASYAQDVRTALGMIANATVKLQSNPEGGTLELSILPAFGTHWLAPRLPGFFAACPGITINLSTRIKPFDFSTQRFHAAIHHGRDDWAGTDALKLLEEETVPVGAPELFARSRVSGPVDLRNVALLHLQTRPNAWSDWFALQGLDGRSARGMGFDQFAPMARAAISGLGVALLPRFIAQRDLDAGRLVAVQGAKPVHIGAYYLVWPKARADYPPLVSFRNWLGSLVGGGRGGAVSLVGDTASI